MLETIDPMQLCYFYQKRELSLAKTIAYEIAKRLQSNAAFATY
jgi:hypothetical protein